MSQVAFSLRRNTVPRSLAYSETTKSPPRAVRGPPRRKDQGLFGEPGRYHLCQSPPAARGRDPRPNPRRRSRNLSHPIVADVAHIQTARFVQRNGKRLVELRLQGWAVIARITHRPRSRHRRNGASAHFADPLVQGVEN